jgi:phytanoyl-CoA dioxygenase PhyH
MPSLLRQALLMPFWVAQVFTQEKFFARNPIIGNRWLNEHGLHTARVIAACRLAAARRRRLARLVSAEDRRQLDRDGFIIKRDFLPAPVFADLVAQVRVLRAPAREMVEGDTLTRHIALDPAVLDRVPAARRLLDLPQYRNLVRYAGSSAAAPMVYIQTILSHALAGPSDPQLDLHTDTFHPTVKAWLFLSDVEEHSMPFVYVPGSHRLTPQRLEWERRMSIAASRQAQAAGRAAPHTLTRAISPAMMGELGLPPPRAISVPANTLIVADTFGFHARGASARPTARVEIWAMGRRNPFVPWTGLDPWSIASLGLRKPMLYWKSVDLLERIGLGHQRWRARASVSAFDPA